MELSILIRFRIAAAMVAGVLILGFIGFPMAAPADPLGPVTLFNGNIGIIDAVVFATLAFVTGFAGYFAAYPCGRPLAPLAVPAGLALWTIRSGSVRTLLISNNTVAEKQAVYNTFQWEGLFWLSIVGIGYLGLMAAEKIKPTVLPEKIADAENDMQKNKGLRYGISILATAVISLFCIGILAQDVRRVDLVLGSVVGQPSIGQIAFAVIVSFALAAFLSKILLNVPPSIPTIASVLILIFAARGIANAATLQHMTENWPTAYFPRSICAILPIQVIAFGAIGSVAGYWMGIRYQYWHKHEKE